MVLPRLAVVILIASAATAGLVPVQAHNVGYIGPSDGTHLINAAGIEVGEPTLGRCDTVTPWIGAVCFDRNHIQPSDTFTAAIGIDEDVQIPDASVAAFYCQDMNLDMVCGGAGDHPHMAAFCSTFTLIELGQSGGNWNPNEPVYVFVSPPGLQLTHCGQGKSGVVWHN